MANTQVAFAIVAKDNASDKLDKIGKSFSRFGTLSRSAGNTTAGAFGRIGASATGAAKLGAAGLAVLGASAVTTAPKVIDMAGNLELMGRKSKQVFGSELGRVQKWADANANAMGLTSRQAVGLAAGMSDLLVPMGFTRKAAADMSTKVTGLAGALSEWSGGQKSASEVSDILNSALLGERDALQGLGIGISQAQVDAQVLANKKKGLTFATDEQAQAQATLDLIMAKSTDAQAAFAKGGDSLARKMAVSKAKLAEMGQELLVKATPALTKFAGFLASDVIPALERFGGWVDDNKFKFAEAFIGISQAVVKMAKVVLPVVSTIDHAFRGFIGGILESAARVDDALGGKLGLRKVADNFHKYSETVDKAFDGAIDKANEWDKSLSKTAKEIHLKADIEDLENKLKTAKTQLADKSLSRDRKAQIKADIKDLEAKLRAAKSRAMLADPKLVQARVAKLEGNKKGLDTAIARAKEALKDPKLTATKRAKLTAEIGELQRRRKAAQAEIDKLHGKTVTVELKFTSGGVNLSAPSSVGRRAIGGPINGPGSGTSDTAGLFALSNKEWVIRAKAAEKYGPKAMASVNAGTATVIPMASGGPTWPAFDSRYNAAVRRGSTRFGSTFGPYGRALSWAKSQDPKHYQWGGVGNPGWDCSGFMSGITNVILGRSPNSRLFATGSFPTGMFSRGMGLFSIGSRRGNPGHMAGTLLGVNVESRGGDGVVIGSGARGARNGLFGGNVWHLGRLAAGGRAGDAPFDLLDPRGRNFLGGDVVQALSRGVLNRDRGGPVPPGRLAYNGTSHTEAMGFGQPIVIDARGVRGPGRFAAEWLVEIIRTNPAVAQRLKVLLS